MTEEEINHYDIYTIAESGSVLLCFRDEFWVINGGYNMILNEDGSLTIPYTGKRVNPVKHKFSHLSLSYNDVLDAWRDTVCPLP